MTTISVNSASPYSVRIDRGISADIADFVAATDATKVAIVTQTAVDSYAQLLRSLLAERGLEVVVFDLPDGEAAKTLEVTGQCWDVLGANNFGRRDLVIGLGGGAATDLAGFIAATWMRGIRVVQVPTTLLAMVDAAVGGKTGINTAAGKNLVGAFHEPSAVFIDLQLLDSLPREELIAGSAEIIKTGFIADPEILALYEQDAAKALDPAGFLPELVARSVQVKADVVGQDLKESGLREILNYGHTFGHAVELCENFRWRHGNAVAVGMMFVAHLAHLEGLISEELLQRHRAILESIGLPTRYADVDFGQLYDAMTRDKKNRSGNIRFVVLHDVAQCERLNGPSKQQLQVAFEALNA